MMSPRLPGVGLERATTRTVSFSYPFTLGKSEDVLPAGDYEVETVEESVDVAGGAVHLCKSTTLIIRTAAGFRCHDIPSGQLEEALIRDSNHNLKEPSENPDRRQAADGHE